MQRRKPTPMYRPLLRDAWRITWQRKSLWVFGLFAAVLSTGGVCELAWRGLRRVETGADVLENVLHGSIAGFETFGTYVQLLQLVPAPRVTLIVTAIILFFVLLIAGSVTAQAALISGVREKEHPSSKEIIRHGHRHFWQVLLLNLLAKIAIVLLTVLTTLPIVLLNLRDFASESLLYIVILAIFLPTVIVIQTLFMFALIAMVREEEHALNGLHLAVTLFRQHWIAALEFGLAQFLLVFGAWVVSAVAFLLLLVPFTILLMLAVLSSTPVLLMLAYVIGMLGAFFFLFVVVGGTTTFQYAAWSLFYERGLHRPGRATLKAKVHRITRSVLGK